MELSPRCRLTACREDAARGDGGDEDGAEQVEPHAEPLAARDEEEPGARVHVLVLVERAHERALHAVRADRLQAMHARADVCEDGAASCREGRGGEWRGRQGRGGEWRGSRGSGW